ncbi:hypothetical protein NE237_028371 [Protea cynaroides]|uniref:Uncharacterized protein n=1 Tax=Protea cynaroides TaxID=273540 RepID=A0A9Q0GQ85_9MAGN|nr:hypothetical protein NE237_028371 [Protea cynaroides]
MKKASSGKLSCEQVLKYASQYKRYMSLYASLLKSDVSRMVVDGNKEIEEIDHGLNIEVILKWRSGQSTKDESEPRHFSEEDWEQLNKIIGYKEGDSEQLLTTQDRGNILHTFLEVLLNYPVKVWIACWGSYLLLSPNGLLAESATMNDSLVGIFSYKRFDAQVDWSLVPKASSCYMINDPVSPTIAVETAAAVQMTIDGVKRTAQQMSTEH